MAGPAPDEGTLVSFASLVYVAITGIVSSAITLAIAAARTGTLVAELRAADRENSRRIDELREEFSEYKSIFKEHEDKLDARHEATNVKLEKTNDELHRLATAMQLVPTRIDSAQFQSKVESQLTETRREMAQAITEMRKDTTQGFSDLRDMLIRAPQTWHAMEAQAALSARRVRGHGEPEDDA